MAVNGERHTSYLTCAKKKRGELKLFIHILSADNVPNLDDQWYCRKSDVTDAFVKVISRYCVQKTDVIDNNLNPAFHQEFYLGRRFIDTDKITLKLFDHNISINQLIGTVVLNVSDIVGTTQMSLSVPNEYNEDCILHVRFEYDIPPIPRMRTSRAPRTLPQSSEPQSIPPCPPCSSVIPSSEPQSEPPCPPCPPCPPVSYTHLTLPTKRIV